MTSWGENSLNIRTNAPNVTGPGVRRSKRPLLASRIRCNVLWKPPKFCNKGKTGNKVQVGNKFPNWCNVWYGEKLGFFPCNTGLRQGENLSPFLFSLYLNDIESFLGNSNVKGAKCVTNELEERLNVYLKLFILLYADDTVLFSESLEDLQLQLNLFYDYCSAWRLKVNISKTKAIVFSRTRPKQNTRLYFGEELIEYVENFNYLGVNLSRNGSFNDAIWKKSNVKKATIAMYEILKKGRKFNLSISCQYDLFDIYCHTHFIIWMRNMGIHKCRNDWKSPFKIL